jgi:hypothetical protein
MKRLRLYRLSSSLHRFIAVNTIWIIQKSSYKSAKLSDTYVKAKMTKFSALLWKLWKCNEFC